MLFSAATKTFTGKLEFCTRVLCREVTSKNTLYLFKWALVNTLGSLVGNRLVNGDVKKYNSQIAINVNKNVSPFRGSLLV